MILPIVCYRFQISRPSSCKLSHYLPIFGCVKDINKPPVSQQPLVQTGQTQFCAHQKLTRKHISHKKNKLTPYCTCGTCPTETRFFGYPALYKIPFLIVNFLMSYFCPLIQLGKKRTYVHWSSNLSSNLARESSSSETPCTPSEMGVLFWAIRGVRGDAGEIRVLPTGEPPAHWPPALGSAHVRAWWHGLHPWHGLSRIRLRHGRGVDDSSRPGVFGRGARRGVSVLCRAVPYPLAVRRSRHLIIRC